MVWVARSRYRYRWASFCCNHGYSIGLNMAILDAAVVLACLYHVCEHPIEGNSGGLPESGSFRPVIYKLNCALVFRLRWDFSEPHCGVTTKKDENTRPQTESFVRFGEYNLVLYKPGSSIPYRNKSMKATSTKELSIPIIYRIWIRSSDIYYSQERGKRPVNHVVIDSEELETFWTVFHWQLERY